MKSRVVCISKFTKDQLINGVIPHSTNNWITLKWFHAVNYLEQETLNDASEIFADEIIQGLSAGHFLRIESCDLVQPEYVYEVESILLKNIITKEVIK